MFYINSTNITNSFYVTRMAAPDQSVHMEIPYRWAKCISRSGKYHHMRVLF